MKRNIFCFYGFAVCAALCLCACSQPLEPTGTQLSKAVTKASAGDWAGADAIAKRILKQEKDNVNALMLRAMARNNLDSRQEALDFSLRAVELAPKLFLAQYLKGMLLYKNGKYDLALAPLREARQLRPDDLNTLILLAETSLALKNYDGAAGYFSLLARQENFRKTTFPWNGIGICYASRYPRKALAFFRISEQLAPRDPATALNLAVLYDSHLRQEADARKYYERFIQLTTGKAEFDPIRGGAELRLDSMKGR